MVTAHVHVHAFGLRRLAPLLKPVGQLRDLGPLGRLDLLGQRGDVGGDIILGQDDVAHLDGLLMVGDHHLGEHHVSLGMLS